jgi:DNA-binding HxlR family transcriptional regulator
MELSSRLGPEARVGLERKWRYTGLMTRTHEEVSDSPAGKYEEPTTPEAAADAVERALGYLDGRWKLVISFRLFGGRVLRFSELERAIPGISQKMLAQTLRQMLADGLISRVVHAEVPPRVEYRLTAWGQSLCPALEGLLRWSAARPAPPT